MQAIVDVPIVATDSSGKNEDYIQTFSLLDKPTEYRDCKNPHHDDEERRNCDCNKETTVSLSPPKTPSRNGQEQTNNREETKRGQKLQDMWSKRQLNREARKGIPSRMGRG